MDVSKFLAKVIGVYLIIVTIVMFVNMDQFISNVNGLVQDGPLMFVAGFFTLIVGLLLVISHNIWQWNWRVIITILACITLIKGISLILYPRFVDQATLLFTGNVMFAYFGAVIDFIIGLILCYFGFKR